MAQDNFFRKGEGISLADLAYLCQGELGGSASGSALIDGLAALGEAGPADLTFFDNIRYTDALAETKAGCVVMAQRSVKLARDDLPLLIVRDPSRAFTLAGQALFPAAVRPLAVVEGAGIHPAAYVDPAAVLEDGVVVEPNAVVGAGARIGSGTIIGAGSVIGPLCCIGRECSIGPNVTIQHSLIGNRVVLHPGVRLGQDGFGYAAGREGIVKTVQIGRVIIQDDVEIGANTTIDRGAIRDTVVGENTKIDNQVQIGHNVRVGRNCLIVSQVGIAGSATLGDGVAIGGQSGVNGHITAVTARRSPPSAPSPPTCRPARDGAVCRRSPSATGSAS